MIFIDIVGPNCGVDTLKDWLHHRGLHWLKLIILAFRFELVSSLPDCRGLFAVIRVHVVMPGRRARARTSGVDTSKGRKCLRCRKCIVSTNYDKYLRS